MYAIATFNPAAPKALSAEAYSLKGITSKLRSPLPDLEYVLSLPAFR